MRIRSGLPFIALVGAAAVAPPASAQRQVSPADQDSVLRSLVAETLERNPLLRRHRAAVQAAERRVRPAGALPDPMLEAGVMDLTLPDFAASRSDFTEWDVSVSQAVPWPGTLGARTRVAREAGTLAHAELEALRRDLTVAVAEAYYRLRHLATVLATLERQRRLLDAARQLSTTRYATGLAPQSDPIQARLALERLASEEQGLLGEHAAVLASLNALRARPSTDSAPAPPLDTASVRAHLTPLPPAESLLASALRAHPRLVARRAAAAQAAQTIRLERLAGRPDFSVMARYGYRGRVAGQALPDFVSLFVGLRLPLWRGRKQDQLVAAARADSAGAADLIEDAERDLVRAVVATAERAEAGRRRLELLVGGVVPAARATVESVLRSYQVGRTEFLTLLAAVDALYRAELETAEVAASHLSHLVMLRELTAEETEP